MSIEHDDNDLIFISGGIEKSEYNCNDILSLLYIWRKICSIGVSTKKFQKKYRI